MSTPPAGGSVVERIETMNDAFSPQAPVHRQELLAGRQEQLFDLLDVSTSVGAHAAIYGERGVGKTSVAAVFEADLLRQGVRVARINASENATFHGLWRDMAEEWLSKPDVSGMEADSLASLMHGTPSQASLVRSFELISSERRAVVIFDEFDVIADEGVGADFANLMKAISDKSLNVHIVIVGVAEDVDSILMGHASAGRGLMQVKMPRLDVDELRSILVNGFGALDTTLLSDIEQRIVRLSQGLPHYTHLLGKEVARRAVLAERYETYEADWEPALNRALTSAQQQVVDLYATATTTAKPSMFPSLLLGCAMAPTDQQGFFRPTDVLAPMNKNDDRTYQVASVTGNLASLASYARGPALQSREFADKRKRYRFANPLLQPYVLSKAVAEHRISLDDLNDSI